MKFAKSIKWQIGLVVLGGALVMTGTVYAQEIDNQHFDTPATSASGNFNTPAQTVSSPAADNTQAEHRATLPVAGNNKGDVDEASVTMMNRADGVLVAISLMILGVVMYRTRKDYRWNDQKRVGKMSSTIKNTLFPRSQQVS